MSTWLHTQTVPDNYRLNGALNKSYRRTRIERYRSRTDVTSEHIWTALSWYRLPKLSEDAENEMPGANSGLFYITKAVPRGVAPETAVSSVNGLIQSFRRTTSMHTILTFNTATAAAGSQAIKEMLDADEACTELNVRTMLTSAPNHKIHIYKYNREDYFFYVILNNIDSPNVLFKIAAAIMLDMDYFCNEEVTKKFAEAWMTGQPDAIIAVINDYFAEFDATKKERELNKTLTALTSTLSERKLREYKNEIQAAEDNIQLMYNEIATATRKLNQKKGEYLLYLTRKEDERVKDLATFLKSCDKSITTLEIKNNTLIIVYHTTLMYYDPALLECYFSSTRENIVTEAAEWKQQLLKDVFTEQKYKLHIESTIAVNLTENTFRYVPLENYVATEERAGIPNPHHKYFNCWGDNESRIRRAILNADYITALTTAFAAMSGLNLSDTSVVNRFLSEELYYADYANTPCLEDTETGELISITEYERRFRNAPNETNE